MAIYTLVSDLNYGSNIGMIIRTVQVYGIGRVYIHDPKSVMESQHEEVRRFSTDLLDRGIHEIVNDLEAFLDSYDGRAIATDISEEATPLGEFEFNENDLILVGNERVGLSDPILAECDGCVMIPMLGKPYNKRDFHPGQPIHGIGEYPAFNVTNAHAIVLWEALRQTGAFNGFKYGDWGKT